MPLSSRSALLLPVLMLGAAPATAATAARFGLSVEAPGVQASTARLAAGGVEGFDGQAPGRGRNFVSDFGSGGVFTGTYRGVDVLSADRYGGAGGGGRYAATFRSDGMVLDITAAGPQPANYFGLWLSALDPNNQLILSRGGQAVFTLGAADIQRLLATLPDAGRYRCNPNAAFAGQNCGEASLYLNIYGLGDAGFDQVAFRQPHWGGFESDNHAVGRWQAAGGTIFGGARFAGGVGAVPEPASWALLIAGFAMIGSSLRRQRRTVAA